MILRAQHNQQSNKGTNHCLGPPHSKSNRPSETQLNQQRSDPAMANQFFHQVYSSAKRNKIEIGETSKPQGSMYSNSEIFNNISPQSRSKQESQDLSDI